MYTRLYSIRIYNLSRNYSLLARSYRDVFPVIYINYFFIWFQILTVKSFGIHWCAGQCEFIQCILTVHVDLARPFFITFLITEWRRKLTNYIISTIKWLATTLLLEVESRSEGLGILLIEFVLSTWEWFPFILREIFPIITFSVIRFIHWKIIVIALWFLLVEW